MSGTLEESIANSSIPFCHRMKAEHCVIQWAIKHYSMFHENQVSPHPTIVSPKFYASDSPKHTSTLWSLAMYLSKGKETDFGVFLHREPGYTDDQPGEVTINFRIGLLDTNKNLKIYGQKRCTAKKNYSSGFAPLLEDYDKNNLHEFLINDTLSVYCEMIVVDRTLENITRYRTPFISFNMLSSDILKLFGNPDGSDFWLITKGLKTPCHKFLLCARSLAFSRSMHNAAEEDSLEGLGEDLLSALLVYLYSGDLRHIMFLNNSIPLGLYEAAALYGLWGLHKFLIPKEIAFTTAPEFVNFKVLWNIPNFLSFLRSRQVFISYNNAFYTSGGIKWFLQITRNTIEGSEYIGVFVRRDFRRNYRESILLDVSVLRTEVELDNFHTSAFCQCDRGSGLYGFADFISRGDVEDCITPDGILKLKINFSVCHGYSANIAVSTRDFCVVADYLPEKSGERTCEPDFKELSENLKAVYENQVACDLIFRAKNEEFKVHECILNVRAGTDSDRLKQLLLADLDPSIVNPLIYFLYTGTASLGQACTLYRFLCKSGMTELIGKFPNYLLQNMTTDIVRRVPQKADDFNDDESQDSLMHFTRRSARDERVLYHELLQLLITRKELADYESLTVRAESMVTSDTDSSDNVNPMECDDTTSN